MAITFYKKQIFFFSVLLCIAFSSCIFKPEKTPCSCKEIPALTKAVYNDQFEEVKRLISEGANIEVRDKDNSTPLMSATIRGNKLIMEFLISKGADVNARDKDLGTPLFYALDSQSAKVLLKHGADINAQNIRGETALLQRMQVLGEIKNRHVEVAEFFILNGADLYLTDKYHLTPLHVASLYGLQKIVFLLLERKVPVDPRTDGGETPLHMAARKGEFEIAEMLIDLGANVNAQDKALVTPLHTVAIDGYKEFTELLLSHGADPFLCDADGHTPLQCAKGLKPYPPGRVKKPTDKKAVIEMLQLAQEKKIKEAHN